MWWVGECGCGALVVWGFVSGKVGLVVDRRADEWVDVTNWRA